MLLSTIPYIKALKAMNLDRIFGLKSEVVCLLLVDNQIRRRIFDPNHPPEESYATTATWR